MASLPDRLILAYQQYRDRDLVTAQQTCQALLEQAPDHPEALALMGCIWHGLGHNDRAEACWRQTIALKPDYAEAHNNLGAVLQGRGDLEGAITHYQQAITHHPAYAEAYCNLGNALQLQEQLEAAIAHYQRAIQLKPDYAEAHSNLGTAYQRQKQFDAAIAHYQQALALRSDYPETHYNWGRLLEEQENFAEAESHYHQAIALKPNYAAAHNQLGYRQQQRHAYAEAEYHYRQAIAFGFESVDTLHCLAVVLHNQGKYEAAIAQYQATIARKPDHSHAHLNMAIAYLTVGDFATGWREYEWRWQVPEFQGLVFSAHPRWDGSDLNGQTILLHSEQGLGDTIQFVRYAPLVAQRGGTVLVSCPESLRRLFATVPGVSQVVERFVPNHRFQTYAALMSLPYLLGTTVDTIPANVPYLRVSTPPPLTLTAPPTCRLKVGLMWSGNPANGQNFRRSCPLAALAPLWQLTDIAFYSLQKELSPADQAAIATLPIQDLSPYLGDFADTAALIDQLDWVISVDTSVAHLAGAMAKPVWLLLADVADWRWLLDREDSPWYPTMRIFRQSKAGDWDNVIARVVQALKQELLLWGGREEKREKRKEKREEQEPSPEYVNHKTNQLSALASLPSPLTSLKIQTSKLLAQQGLDCLKAQQWESAIAYYQQALPDYPQPAEIHFHLGYAYHQLGDENRAMEQYQRALSLHPDYPEALCNLGNLMQARQQWETAINYYHRVLSLVPNYVDAHNNLGTALFNQGKITAAIEHYQQALKVKPDHLDARYNLGNAYVKQGNLTAASAQYQQVLAQNPNHIGAAHNLGSCLFKQGEIAAAIAYFQQVIALDPNHVDAHCNLSIAWLIQGDFRRGFGEYEWRWRTQHFAKTPPTQPQWDGSDLAGRRILLHPEQGYGDLIQFIRYAPLVAARGGRVIVCCPDNLQRLFATVPGIDRVLNMAISQQDFDICAPLLSLPRLLGTTLETIPATVPYLHAPPDSPLQLKAPRGTRLKVGLVWAGSPEHPNDAQRSCGLRVLWPLLALADIAFYSLQVGAPALELAELPEVYRARVTDLSPQLTDFWETAAAIKQLDLVITVDTSVAHLAGALAKPVWVLLSYLPDWRWLIDREDSPWYPTARLFRQPHPGNWEQVITQVSVALQAYANTKPDHLRKGFIAAAAKTQSQKQKKQSKRSRPKTVTQIIPESTAQKLAKKEERGERREERFLVLSSLFPLPSQRRREQRDRILLA
ncbi:tetratricopeptide repeat protein [Trichothermofontia sp.]